MEQYVRYIIILGLFSVLMSCQKEDMINPEDIGVFIPNTFSPDSKGVAENDTFRVVIYRNANEKIYDFELSVFNEYHKLVYYSNDYHSHGWDGIDYNNGQKVNTGLYSVSLIVSLEESKIYTFQTYLNLIRQ